MRRLSTETTPLIMAVDVVKRNSRQSTAIPVVSDKRSKDTCEEKWYTWNIHVAHKMPKCMDFGLITSGCKSRRSITEEPSYNSWSKSIKKRDAEIWPKACCTAKKTPPSRRIQSLAACARRMNQRRKQS